MKKAKKNLVMLFTIPVLMFGFGYLLVPIYDIFCEITGLNGKTGTVSVAEASRMQVDESRMVKVEFMANLNRDMPLDFAPAVASMLVHPGKIYQSTYGARNREDAAIIGQAVPSVSPSKASTYFNKTECFCFSQQAFEAGEQRDLPLIFVVDPDLPKDIETITLSYTFFEVDAADDDGDHDDEYDDEYEDEYDDEYEDEYEDDHDHDHDHDHDDDHDHDHKVRVEG